MIFISKLYEFYKICKEQNPDNVFLIKSGNFYLLLDQDAISLSDVLGLKLTQLNENILKCGFPVISLPKYEKMLKANSINYSVTSLSSASNNCTNVEKEITNEIRLLDINKISPIAALNLLVNYKERLKCFKQTDKED